MTTPIQNNPVERIPQTDPTAGQREREEEGTRATSATVQAPPVGSPGVNRLLATQPQRQLRGYKHKLDRFLHDVRGSVNVLIANLEIAKRKNPRFAAYLEREVPNFDKNIAHIVKEECTSWQQVLTVNMDPRDALELAPDFGEFIETRLQAELGSLVDAVMSYDPKKFIPLVPLKEIDTQIKHAETERDYSEVGRLRIFRQLTELLDDPTQINQSTLLSLAGKLQTFTKDTRWLEITGELQYKPDAPETREFLLALYNDFGSFTSGEGLPVPTQGIKETAGLIVKSVHNFNLTAMQDSFSGVPEAVDLRHVISTEIGMLKPLTSDYLNIRLSVDAGAEENFTIFMDSTHISEIVQNLVINAAGAVQGSTSVGRPVEYEVKLTRQGDSIVLEFNDKGPGIPEDIVRKIQTGEETSTSEGADKGGLAGKKQGFGMQNCRRYVKAVTGGKFLIESRQGPDSGTNITITLPYHDPRLSAGGEIDVTPLLGTTSRATEVSPVTERRPSPTGPFRVLFVDDNRDAADSMQLLAKYGCKGEFCFDVAYSGAQALELINNGPYHLVLCDLNLSDITGSEVKKRMEAMGIQGTKFMTYTGIEPTKVAERYSNLKIEEILFKPVEPETITTMIDTLYKEREK